MTLIIVCHMFSYYGSELALWFNVGVQIFFIISGFLYGAKEIDSPISFIKKNYVKILVPYWLFLFLAILLYALFCRDQLGAVDIVKAFLCSGTINGLGHLWFVGYILFCYFLTPYLYWLRKYLENGKTSVTIYVDIFVLVIIQLVGFFFDSYFEPDKVTCYVLGFFLADIFHKCSNKERRTITTFFIVLALMVNGMELYFKYFSNWSFVGWQDTVFRAACRYSHLLLGLMLFLTLYGHFTRVQYGKLLSFTDKYSYPVYLVHQLFILSPLNLMAVSGSVVLNWLIVITVILLSGILLYKLAQAIEKPLQSFSFVRFM